MLRRTKKCLTPGNPVPTIRLCGATKQRGERVVRTIRSARTCSGPCPEMGTWMCRLNPPPRQDGKVTMYNPTEQITEFNKANVASAIKLASISIEKAEKLVSLNLNAAKLALAQGVEGAQAAASVKDVQELMALRSKIAELGVQTALGYSRTLYELSTEASSEFSAFAEQAWSSYTRNVAAFVEKASAAAPAGSDFGLNAFRSTIAASTAAFDQFQKPTKQVVSLADASV